MFRSSSAGPGARTALMITALALASMPVAASAQTCAEGRVSSEATAGRCCWPGQAWSDASRSCEGTPSCPAPWVAHGDTCVAPVIAASPVSPVSPASPAPSAVPATVEAAPPTFYVPTPGLGLDAELVLEEDPNVERRPRFIAYGTTGVLVSWTAWATMPGLLLIFGVSGDPALYFLQTIPVVGPLIAPLASPFDSTFWWGYGILGSSLQITAWIILIVGLVNQAADRPREQSVRVQGNGIGITF